MREVYPLEVLDEDRPGLGDVDDDAGGDDSGGNDDNGEVMMMIILALVDPECQTPEQKLETLLSVV